MTDLSPNVRADFFGKDKMTFFLGNVEDVNDPKQSGRVKVRCVGWHPNQKGGDDGVSTEDLPWAHVCMPTTHAQQGRVGGKHGLLPGCWVMGFFFDGDEAQQPIVMNSFPFVAKASGEDNRERPEGEDGTLEETDQAFAKVIPNPKQHPNISQRTPDEQGQGAGFGSETDQAGDTVTSEADDPCHGPAARQSVAAQRRMDEDFKKEDNGNAESQKYSVTMADGMCGSNPHARDDIQRKLTERMPSQFSRFVYGDAVWNRFTGNFIDLNGLLMQLALEICNLLKQPANASKARVEYDENRRNKAQRSIADPDRDFCDPADSPRLRADDQTSREHDFFHGEFQTGLIDILCQLILNILQQMNNGTAGEGQGNNLGGGLGTDRNTPVNDWNNRCIADTILDTVNTLTDIAIENSRERARQRAENDDDEVDIGAIAGILGTLIGGMFFPLTQRYSVRRDVHNRAGDQSQDVQTKEVGCRAERMFNTTMGAMASGGGGGAGGAGGGQGSGEGGAGAWLPNVGFGGLPGPGSGEINTLPCDESLDQRFPDGGFTGGGGTDLGAGGGTDLGAGGGTGLGSDGNRKPGTTVPSGGGCKVITLPLPSEAPKCAANFVNGIPNVAVVIERGQGYFFNNEKDSSKAYPSVYVKGYDGIPVPVVDSDSGEMVALLTSCSSFAPGTPTPPVTVIPDSSEIGIRTDDPNYDIVIESFFIANTGFGYCDPTITVVDRNKEETNGKVSAVVVDGRIVDVEIINNGRGFMKIPDIVIKDNGYVCGTKGGYGAKVYPIMKVVPRPQAKQLPMPQEVIYCSTKKQKNLYNGGFM